jgi:hypothetical protein
LCFNQINCLYDSPLLPAPIIPQHSVCFLMPSSYIASSYTDAIYFDVIYSLSFSFPVLPLHVPSNSTTVTDMFSYMYVYMTMFLFVLTFSFWVYLPSMSENMWPLSFWTRLTSHNMIMSSFIHLSENGIISFFFYGWVILHCVYI